MNVFSLAKETFFKPVSWGIEEVESYLTQEIKSNPDIENSILIKSALDKFKSNKKSFQFIMYVILLYFILALLLSFKAIQIAIDNFFLDINTLTVSGVFLDVIGFLAIIILPPFIAYKVFYYYIKKNNRKYLFAAIEVRLSNLLKRKDIETLTLPQIIGFTKSKDSHFYIKEISTPEELNIHKPEILKELVKFCLETFSDDIQQQYRIGAIAFHCNVVSLNVRPTILAKFRAWQKLRGKESDINPSRLIDKLTNLEGEDIHSLIKNLRKISEKLEELKFDEGVKYIKDSIDILLKKKNP